LPERGRSVQAARLAIQIGAGEGASLHRPAYDFNDEAIPAGASYWAELIESRLPAG